MDLQKQRFLAIHEKGTFTRLPPSKVQQLHDELAEFFRSSSDSLSLVDRYDLYELQFYLLLITNNDIEAKSYLDRINDQIGTEQSQRLLVLRSVYYEAVGDESAAEASLGNNPDDLRLLRRLATFSRRKKNGDLNLPEYIKNLNFYLDLQPSDVEAWAELGDQYNLAGHYDKAAFCFQEVLLQNPLAYNIFYQVGLAFSKHLAQLLAEQGGKAQTKKRGTVDEKLVEAFRLARDNFLRSVELSPSYTKGWVSLYELSTSELVAHLEALSVAATSKLGKQANAVKKTARERIFENEKLATEAEFAMFIEKGI